MPQEISNGRSTEDEKAGTEQEKNTLEQEKLTLEREKLALEERKLTVSIHLEISKPDGGTLFYDSQNPPPNFVPNQTPPYPLLGEE